MDGEFSKDEDIKIKAKLKEMQKHIPFLQEFLISLQNGENNIVKESKVKMAIEILMNKKICTKLATLIRLEEVIQKIKVTKETRATQEMAKISGQSKSLKGNASEVINVESSDDDDVKILPYTASYPKRNIPGSKEKKSSTCAVLIETKKDKLTFPDKIQKIEQEDICTVANKEATSDINKNNDSVPDLTDESEKMDESFGTNRKNHISSNFENKIKINLMPKKSLTSDIPKTCDFINKEPNSASVSIPNENNSSKSTANISKSSKNMDDESSITQQVEGTAPKVIECNKFSSIADSKLTAETTDTLKKNETQPNEIKDTLKLKEIDLEDISSDEQYELISSRELSPDEKRNKDDKRTSLLNQATTASSKENSVLFLNDSRGKINVKKLLPKERPKSPKCEILNRSLSYEQSSSTCNATKLKSVLIKPPYSKLKIRSLKKRAYSTSSNQRWENKISSRQLSQAYSLDDTRTKVVKVKNQVQALKLAMKTISKETPVRPLQERLINAGLLSDRRNSLKQVEEISCTVTTTKDPKNTNGPQNPIKPLSTMIDNTSDEISNNLDCNSNEKRKLSPETVSISPTVAKSPTRISVPEKTSEEENVHFPSVELSNPEKGLGNTSSPLKDSTNEEQLSNEPGNLELAQTLQSDFLINQSEQNKDNFNFEQSETFSDTHNESDLSNFPCCTKVSTNFTPVTDTESNLECENTQDGGLSTVRISPTIADSVVEASKQKEKPLESRVDVSEKVIVDSAVLNKILNSVEIQNILEQNRSVFNKFLTDSVNETSPDEASNKANTQDESCSLEISQLDKRGKKSLDELHEIRFQLEKEMGVNLSSILYSGQNEASRNISKSRLISMKNTMNKENFTNEPPQTLSTLPVYDEPRNVVIQPTPTRIVSNQPESSQLKHCTPIANEILRSHDQNAQNKELETIMTTIERKIKQEALAAQPAWKKTVVEAAKTNHQLMMETNREKRKSENIGLNNFERKTDATSKKVQSKTDKVKFTPEKENSKAHQSKPDKLKTLKVSKQRRNTVHVETEPRKSPTVESRTRETIKVRRNSLKTIQIEVEPRSKSEIARKKAIIPIPNIAQQLELESERRKQETLRSVGKEKTVEKKTRRTSVPATSSKSHQPKLKTGSDRSQLLKVGKERRCTIQVGTVLEAESAKQKFVVESAPKKTQVGRERRETTQQKIKTTSETATTKNKFAGEAVANKVLTQNTSKNKKEKYEAKVTPKNSSQNTSETESSYSTVSNFEGIEIKIATRKRKKPILESSSDSEPEETHRRKKTSIFKEESSTAAIPNIRKRRTTTGGTEISCNVNNNVSNETRTLRKNSLQLDEFEKRNLLNKYPKLNPNEIKKFACSLVQPLLKRKPFKMFQNILNNCNLKTNRRKSTLPNDGRISKQNNAYSRELKALHKDLEQNSFGEAVRNITGRRKSCVNCLNVLSAMKNVENAENMESEEELLKTNTSNISNEDYDTDSFEEYSNRKKEEEIHSIIKNPPIVLLQKLTPEDLMKLPNLSENTTTSTSKADEHLSESLRPVQIKDHSIQRKSESTMRKSKENKNTNPIWHYKDPSFSTSCILCSHKSSQIVAHYLESHPQDEVYVSRLPLADVLRLEENPGRATRHLKKPHKYIAECFFCSQTMHGHFDKFSNHYASHTGEFPYKCSACTFRSCKKSDMVNHTRNKCNKDAQLQKYCTYDKNVTKILLYICTKCNYMQLHKDNIVEHYRKEHDCNELHETDVKALTLLELVDDSQQNIIIVNEPVSLNQTSDEEIVAEDENLEPIKLEKSNNDTDSVIPNVSIAARSETLSIDSLLHQSIESNQISGISTDLRIENPELPKSTTHGDKITNIEHNCESKDRESPKGDGSENENDGLETLLRILTSTPSTTPIRNDLFRATDQHNEKEDLTSFGSANVESQKLIEESDQLNKSNLPTECQLQNEAKESNENNMDGSVTADSHKQSSNEKIQKNSIPVIEILDDDDDEQKPFIEEHEVRALFRIDNCGYQEIRNGEYIFHCLVSKCNFGMTISFQVLRDHVKKKHDVLWSGKCNVCKYKLTPLPGKQSIEEELNHMISVHINEAHDSESADEDPVINILKPWLSDTRSCKKKILCESMVSETVLTRLYKCMGDDCSFTSGSKGEMSKHLAVHEVKTRGQVDCKRPWLECCYCEHYADKALQILEHVDCGHSSSIFQCSRCFYRSRSQFNVKNHQDQHHLNNVEKNAILTCGGNIKTVIDNFKRLQKLKEDNIKAVSCPVCTQEYIRKDLMIEHFKIVHGESVIPKDLKMGLYGCIFCNFEENRIIKMCYHMANKHPTELLLFGVRGIKDNSVKNDISSIAVLDEKIEVANIKSESNDISFDADLMETEHQLENSDIKKFKDNLMNFEDLINLSDPSTTCSTIKENENTETNERSLTALCTKMVNSLNYFLKSEILQPCCICSKEINLEGWKDHFNTAHPTIGQDANLRCQCQKIMSVWTYSEHFINQHTDQHKRYFCYYCADHFYNSDEANKHLLAHVGKEEEPRIECFESSQASDAGDNKINSICIVIPATNTSEVVEIVKHMIKIAKKKKEEQLKSTNAIDMTIDLNKNICCGNYPEYVPKNERYVCRHCNNKLIDRQAFENHFETAHKNILTFECPHCDLVISPSDYKAVDYHLRLHSQEIYKCHLCSMYTDNIELLIKHLKSYKQQSVPIVHFTRGDKVSKYNYKIIHFSPLSTNRMPDKKIQCYFCPTQVDTYKNLDMHLSNAHRLGRTYMCYYCSYQGDIIKVNSHIKNIHVKPNPKKFRFISTTVFLAIQNQEGNCSHLPDAENVESTNNASCSKVVVEAEDASKKRKYNDIFERTASDQNGEVEKRRRFENLEPNTSDNFDPSVKDSTTGKYHECNLCAFKCTNYEHFMSHTETHVELRLNSSNSIQNHAATTLSVVKATPLPSSSNKATTDLSKTSLEIRRKVPMVQVHLVPMNKLLRATAANKINVPQPSASEQLVKRSLPAKKAINKFIYVCFHCGTKFDNYYILQVHWRASYCPSNENKSYRFIVAQKDNNFILRRDLNKIIETAQTRSWYYECSDCGIGFFDKDYCTHHILTKAPTSLSLTYLQSDIFYGCNECKVFYKNEEHAIWHIAQHTFRFACVLCPGAYKNIEELNVHYLDTHKINEKAYKYDVTSSRNMEIFQRMLVVFPCGLIVTKYYLRRTSWGNEKAFLRLIYKSTREGTNLQNSWNFYGMH